MANSTTRSALNKANKARIEKATVWLPKIGGQGILVAGRNILTAAHCIEWSGVATTSPGEDFLEPIETKEGRSFDMQVCAAEPLADIAVLCGCDSQDSDEDSQAFEEFCELTPHVMLSMKALNVRESMRVHILTHTGAWVTGTATRLGPVWSLPNGTLSLEADKPLLGGTSGGPIVDEDGQLVGVVCCSSPREGHRGRYEGGFPVARLALPRWLLDQIETAERAPAIVSFDPLLDGVSFPTQEKPRWAGRSRKSPPTSTDSKVKPAEKAKQQRKRK